jgi:hypothetical protein
MRMDFVEEHPHLTSPIEGEESGNGLQLTGLL